MQALTNDFNENVRIIDEALRVKESFDIIKRELEVNSHKIVMYYIDGFVTSAIMQKLIMHITTVKEFGTGKAGDVDDFVKKSVPGVEVDAVYETESMVTAVLSGCSLIIADGFGKGGVVVDARSYPARVTEEPENDKVMRGARDGFVETLIFNVAMIRRRIRTPDLTVKYLCVGEKSKTDLSVVYIDKKADIVYNLYRKCCK